MFRPLRVGIMIETPIAAMNSDLFAKEVDFFSIGTNDLSQYCMGLDRENPNWDIYYQECRTGILKMIHLIL